ncbi:MAG: hypothetical protein R3D88_03610 [Alphaproteobacteria bacterium]|nr:hypothetical protein [Alphaproteobacteria bacterium]
MESPLDEKEYPKLALRQIRALCQGNGAAPKDVKIVKMQGEIIHCEAITHLELHPEVMTDKKIGRHQIGQPLENPAQIDKAVQSHIRQAMKNSDVRKFMANILLERKDKGFSFHAQYFDVPPLNKTFSYQEPCGTCQGNGKTTCNRCNGQRREVCNVCHARGMVPCTYCHSTGFRRGADGNQTQCTYCRGQRQIICRTCQKRGSINCRQCNGAGTVGCNSCRGNSYYTVVTQVVGKMKTLFEIDRAALPHPVVKAIEDTGGKLVSSDQIKLTAEQVKREDGGLAIQYHTQFPYGDMLMSINGKPYKMHIFGYKAKLIKVPLFLEELISPQLIQLFDAAKSPASVVSNITKASKSRVIGQALILTLTMPKKAALIALKKKFPFGIHNERLKEIIQMSQKALNNLTAKARYTGFAMAATFNAIATWLYFTSGIRGTLSASIGLQGLMAADLALIPLGGFIGSIITGFMARRPLQKVIGHLMKKVSAKKMVVWPNYGISAGVFILIIIALKILGYETPHWLPL